MLVEVTGTSMSPLLAHGQRLTVDARRPATGDVVLYRAASAVRIKRVVGAPGQHLSLNAGAILIDGTAATTSDGRPYSLSPARAAMLALYAGTIPADAYLVMGDDPAGTDDSSTSGLIHASAIMGVANLEAT